MGRAVRRPVRRQSAAAAARSPVCPGVQAATRATASLRPVESLEPRRLLAADDPFINEFLASNANGLQAADGSRPDWIEVYNPGAAAVNLAGWHLTDTKGNPAEWTFPSTNAALTTVPAGGYKVVFASGNGTNGNQGIISNQLHTNFSLAAGGEYLALTRPDNSVVTAFDPFPAQNADVSYGPGPSSTVTTHLVATPAPVKVRVPGDAGLGTVWTAADFDDAGWTAGTSGVGYEQATGSGTPALPNEAESNNTAGTANDASANFAAVAAGSNLYHIGLKGTVSSSTDADFFNLGAMQAGDVLTVTESGSSSSRGTIGDAFVELWRSNGGSPVLVTGDDDNGPGNDSLLDRFSVTVADTYYVAAKGFSGSSGTYDVGLYLENAAAAPGTGGTLTAETEANNTAAAANNASTSWRQVQYKSTTAGSLSSNADSDYYRFTLTAGDLVTFNADSTSALDARVTLYSSNGTSVVASESGTSARTPAQDSTVYGYIVPATGVYYARVHSATGSGTYNLEAYLSAATPPPAPGNAASYTGLINTNVQSAMRNVNASAYVRLPFAVGEDASVTTLSLSVKYDDGFVAYLNGTEIARRNAGGTPGTPLPFNAAAASDRANSLAQVFETIDVTNFKHLLVTGENVLAVQGLNSSAGDADFLIVPELSYATVTAPGVQYMSTPTPGAANVAGVAGKVNDTKFSVDRGFFTAPFSVTITTSTSGAQIRYTTDGSAPTATTGTVYAGPIPINGTTVVRAAAFKAGMLPTNVDTQTYLFPASTLTQARPASYPVNWIGDNGSGTNPGDYEIDPEVINGTPTTPAYQDEFLQGLRQIPTLSIVTDQNNLFDARNASGQSIATVPNQGIYDHPQAENSASLPLGAWEKPASFELINPDGSQGFEIDGGLRMQGAASRAPTGSSKHSFRIAFRNDYGDGSLGYPMFAGSPATDHAGFILRGTYNNSWTHREGTQRARADFVKDGFARVSQADMGNLAVRQKYVHVYLNGMYWGLYDATDRGDADFAASMLGGDKSQYDAVNAGNAIDGDAGAWNQVKALADAAAINTPQGLNDIAQYLDLTNFADYIIYNTWAGNNDWDNAHNWYGVRRRAAGAGYQFLNWDAERSLEGLNDNATNTNNVGGPSHVFQRLRTNPEFVQLFADRVHKFLFNNGALTPAAATARYRALADQIDDAVVAESARWGDNRRDTNLAGVSGTQKLWTKADWLAERARVEGYFQSRTGVVVGQYQSGSLYPTVAAPEFNQHGGAVGSGFQLTMSNPSGGTVYYTTDGTDPRVAFSGAVGASAVAYNPANPPAIGAAQRVQARVLSGSTWSALTDASFVVGAPPALRVTEVMYNPPAPAAGSGLAAQDMEFIELQNTGPSPIDTSGFTLGFGVTFAFPKNGPVLQPGERVVVAANTAAFQSRYGNGATVVGGWAGDLSDAGDQIIVTSPFGQQIERFTYDDGWYAATDGGGYSLVAADPNATDAALSTAAGWRPSSNLNGAPGAADPGPVPNSVVINEVLSNSTNGVAAGDWVELRNTTAAAVDVGNWFLSDDATNLRKYPIPAGTVIPGNGYVTFTQMSHFGGAFGFADTGGTAYLSQGDAAGNLGGYRESADFGATDPGATYGRYVKSTGGADFTPLVTATFNAANTAPRVGSVVINELMYNPAGTSAEYIELRNRTAADVPLYDPANPQNAWRFTKGIDYTFPAGASIPANGYALVVPIDPAAFRSQYPVPAGVPVFGPYGTATGNVLDNGGENVTLSRPAAPLAGGVVPYVEVDLVNYDDAAPWPAGPDGTGPSLARANAGNYSNDVINWAVETSGGTPGAANLTAFPGVQSVSVGPAGSTVQRSMVTSITVTFDRVVTLDAGAIALTGRDGAGAGMTVNVAPAGDGRSFFLTFTGTGVVGGSAPDGVYDLAVSGPLVHDAGSPAVTMAGVYAARFHRLYSDSDGDGDSDNADLFQVRNSFNKPPADPAFRWYFDVEQDGDVDNADLFQVRNRRAKEFKGY